MILPGSGFAFGAFHAEIGDGFTTPVRSPTDGGDEAGFISTSIAAEAVPAKPSVATEANRSLRI